MLHKDINQLKYNDFKDIGLNVSSKLIRDIKLNFDRYETNQFINSTKVNKKNQLENPESKGSYIFKFMDEISKESADNHVVLQRESKSKSIEKATTNVMSYQGSILDCYHSYMTTCLEKECMCTCDGCKSSKCGPLVPIKEKKDTKDHQLSDKIF